MKNKNKKIGWLSFHQTTRECHQITERMARTSLIEGKSHLRKVHLTGNYLKTSWFEVWRIMTKYSSSWLVSLGSWAYFSECLLFITATINWILFPQAITQHLLMGSSTRTIWTGIKTILIHSQLAGWLPQGSLKTCCSRKFITRDRAPLSQHKSPKLKRKNWRTVAARIEGSAAYYFWVSTWRAITVSTLTHDNVTKCWQETTQGPSYWFTLKQHLCTVMK